MSFLMDNLIARHILTIVIFLPIVGAGMVFVRSRWDAAATRGWALGFSVVTLVLALAACWLFFGEQSVENAQAQGKPALGLVERHQWLGDTEGGPIQVQYLLGVDGISLSLLMLTAFLTPLAICSSFTAVGERHREYYALMLLLQGAMQGVFCAQDLLLFYVFFEFTLVPLYFLIGIWGGPQREKAANLFFLYTLAGSMLTFAGVLYLGWKAFTHYHCFTLELDKLYQLAAQGALSTNEQWWLFLAFFAGFAIKVPLFPLHTWLPLAHTEAPTAGSVILAAVLLKLGTYGFLRLSLPMLPLAAIAWAPFVGWLAVAGIIYGAIAAWVQSDVKKLVAYSSVSHLGFCLLGMFSLKMAGLTGSLLYMINHGLSTGALFLIVGMIYERYHTRELSDLSGLGRKMPIMAFFLVVFTMSSIGLPGLNGFIGEFLVLLGTFTSGRAETGSPAGPLGVAFAIPAATGILLGAIYMLHMVKGVLFGPVKESHGFDASSGLTPDLTRREIGILAPIALVCLLIGVYPKPLTKTVMEPALQHAVLDRVLPVGGATWEQAVTADDRAASPTRADSLIRKSPPQKPARRASEGVSSPPVSIFIRPGECRTHEPLIKAVPMYIGIRERNSQISAALIRAATVRERFPFDNQNASAVLCGADEISPMTPARNGFTCEHEDESTGPSTYPSLMVAASKELVIGTTPTEAHPSLTVGALISSAAPSSSTLHAPPCGAKNALIGDAAPPAREAPEIGGVP